jgi:hypothetical protein
MMKTFAKARKRGLVLAVTSAVLGCKPRDNNDVKTLDNFARTQGLTMNTCVAPDDAAITQLEAVLPKESYTVPLIKYGTVPKQSFHMVLAAVPTSVITAFFMFGGRISLDEGDNSVCERDIAERASYSKIQSERSSDEPVRSACWSPAKDGGIDLWISPKKDGDGQYVDINHGTVRAFGHIFSEIFLRFKFEQREIEGPNSEYRWAAVKDPEMKHAKYLSNLLTAFEADVKLRHKKDDGTDVDGKKVRFDLRPIMDNLNNQSISRLILSYYVFGEAFDSLYCNEKTADTMKENFPSTMAIMENVDRAIANNSERKYGRVRYSNDRFDDCIAGCDIAKLVEDAPKNSDGAVDLDNLFSKQKRKKSGLETTDNSSDGDDDSTYRERTYVLDKDGDRVLVDSALDDRAFIDLYDNSATDGDGAKMFGSVLAAAVPVIEQVQQAQAYTEGLAQRQTANAGKGQATPIGPTSQAVTAGTIGTAANTTPTGGTASTLSAQTTANNNPQPAYQSTAQTSSSSTPRTASKAPASSSGCGVIGQAGTSRTSTLPVSILAILGITFIAALAKPRRQ